MKNLFFALITAFFIQPLINNIYAQQGQYDLEHTVEFINSKLDNDVCRVVAQKKYIQIEFYAKGKIARVDEFAPDAIDIDKPLEFSESEKSLIIHCYENAGKCIERQILSHGTRLFYDRSNLPTNLSEEESVALKNAFKHLIMLYIADDDYNRTKPFEEE